MAIRMMPIWENEKGEKMSYPLYGPVVVCDACGDRIERDEDGLYVWAVKEGELAENRFFHHNNEQTNPVCQEIYGSWDMNMRRKGYAVMWGTLLEFSAQLAHNVGAREKEEKIPKDIIDSAYALFGILRGFLYSYGNEKSQELVDEIEKVMRWAEKREKKGRK